LQAISALYNALHGETKTKAKNTRTKKNEKKTYTLDKTKKKVNHIHSTVRKENGFYRVLRA
jgi:hypothetical protein